MTASSVTAIFATSALTPLIAFGVGLAAAIVFATFGVFASGYLAGRRDEVRARLREAE